LFIIQQPNENHAEMQKKFPERFIEFTDADHLKPHDNIPLRSHFLHTGPLMVASVAFNTNTGEHIPEIG
jgi:hypothetical protein